MCENRSRLEELSAFVNETDDWIDQTLTTLGWTREHVMKVLHLFCNCWLLLKEHEVYCFIISQYFFDTAGWATGSASGL